MSGKITPMKVETFLGLKSDSTHFGMDKLVAVTGYLISVKLSESESCNCHTQNKDSDDFHIYIAASPNDSLKSNMMICEVTRFTRHLSPNLKELKTMIGKKITLTGYLFYDEEHKRNSRASAGKSLIWRATVWEVHPVFTIHLAD